MHEAFLLVNDVSMIHFEKDMYHKSHSNIVHKEDIEIRIPLKMDGIFLYFPTRSLTTGDIDNINRFEAILLTPDLKFCYRFKNSCEEEE